MRLPGHDGHDIASCDACAVFDQVHAERDDLLLRVAQLETPPKPHGLRGTRKDWDHKKKIAAAVREYWRSPAGKARREASRRKRAQELGIEP